MSMPEYPHAVDCIIDARWVIPVDPPAAVLDHHSVIVTEGRIGDVLPTPEARQRYRAKRHTVLAEHALIPGLINLHGHAAMTLMRGLADDKALMDWLNNHIWPVETSLVSQEFV